MARGKKTEKAQTPEEKLAEALVPVEEQPFTISGNWVWAYLKTIASICTGKKDANYGSPDGDYFFFTCAAEPIRCNGYSFDCKALLLAGNGDISNISIYEGKFEAYQRTYVVEIVPNVDIKYIYYYFKYRWVDYNRNKMFGTAIPYIRLGNLQNFPVPIIPIREQQRIVVRIESLFAKLDEAKEKALAVVDSFETRKAAILHKAFTGSLIGKGNVTLVPLESIVDEIRIGPFGSALHEEDYITDGIPVINPKHIANQMIIPQSKVTVSVEKVLELQSYRLKVNDIVLGRRGEMGRAAPVTSKEDGWLCGTGSMIIRLKNKYQAKFYSLIISSQASIQYLESHAVGTTLKNLNEKIVRQLPIPDFTIEEQDKLFHTLDSLLSKEHQAKDAADAVLDQIDTMKKSILARAFHGKLETNDPAEESAVEILKHCCSTTKFYKNT